MRRYCRWCWTRKKKVINAVEIVDGTPICDDCFAQLGVEKKPMAVTSEDRAAKRERIQKAYAPGKKFNKIAAEAGVSWGMVRDVVAEIEGKDERDKGPGPHPGAPAAKIAELPVLAKGGATMQVWVDEATLEMIWRGLSFAQKARILFPEVS